MNKEEIIEMIRDDNTPKELIIAQFETAFKYQMDLQKNIDILHNNQNKLIDEIGEQGKEIERLNNIIDKLDSKLCSTWQLYYDHSRLTTFKCEDMLYLIEQIRKDIKELKESSDKE